MTCSNAQAMDQQNQSLTASKDAAPATAAQNSQFHPHKRVQVLRNSGSFTHADLKDFGIIVPAQSLQNK